MTLQGLKITSGSGHADFQSFQHQLPNQSNTADAYKSTDLTETHDVRIRNAKAVVGLLVGWSLGRQI